MLIKGQMKANGGSTIFTTQTMTEAEALCDRIAIMVNGGLCCITETEKLKKLVGGYHLIVNKKTLKRQKSFSQRSVSPIQAKNFSEIEESDDVRLGFLEDDSPNKLINSRKKKIDLKDQQPLVDNHEEKNANTGIFDCKKPPLYPPNPRCSC